MHASSQLGSLCQRLFIFVVCVVAFSFPGSSRANPHLDCVIVDTDAHLDDIRAIAVLAASSKKVVAIITTEGIARAKEGKIAIEQFLARIGTKIPVIAGAQPNQQRDYMADPHLSEWRETAESLNGTLLNSNLEQHFEDSKEQKQAADPSSIVDELSPLLKSCHHIELLVIGPWTSFMRYGPELLDHIDLIVAQGRPDPDELEGQPAGFNCLYDLNSCLAAYDLLVGRRLRMDRHLRANWVDIPHSPVPLGSADAGIDAMGNPVYRYSPTPAWAADLQKLGNGAAVVSEILLKNPDRWKDTSLWDDLTALYLLRPELFGNRGGHWEPQVSADTILRLLAGYMSRASGMQKSEETR
jgi:hypothetical protein